MATPKDWRAVILANAGPMQCGGSGESSFHVPIDSMAGILGWLLVWHEEDISDGEWGERFYQWGVAAGISKPTMHTITASMIALARTLPWVSDDRSATAPDGDNAYQASMSRCSQDKLTEFLMEFCDAELGDAPLVAVPGLGKVTAKNLSSDGDFLGAGFEPPPPGELKGYKIPITSFPCLMGHLLVFHQEDIDAERWAERFFQVRAYVRHGCIYMYMLLLYCFSASF